MYAVIMAGGEGTRLRPLTLDRPKPLVPVAGKTAIERILSLLARHNIKKAAITTMYLSSMIEDHCGSSSDGIELFYFREDTPLGTAGSVKNTESLLSLDTDDSFIIISGDAVCDLDLSAAVSFHREKNADVTIVLSSSPEPYEYGVVLCDKDGRIERFIEKPGKTQAFADTVNTGIYVLKRSVLELIPKKTKFDFGRDLFPYLLAEGYAMYGCVDNGYWCDVGDLTAFYTCNMTIAREENPVPQIVNITGTGCHIAGEADVRDCILFDRVTVGEQSVIRNAILADNVTVGRGAVIGSGCVVGSGCTIGDNAKINPGIKLYNNVRIGNGVCVMADVFFGEIKADIFGDNGIAIDKGTLTAEYAVRIGIAVAAAAGGGKIGVMSAYNPFCRLIREALLCGICSTGTHGMDLSPDFGGFSSMAAFAAVRLGIGAVLCVYEDEESENIKIDIFDRCGLYPERSFERKTAAVLSGGISRRNTPTEPERIPAIVHLYRSEISHEAGLNNKLTIALNDNQPARLLASALSDAGITVAESAPLKIVINDTGGDISAFENTGKDQFDTDKWHIAAVIARSGLNKEQSLSLPLYAPAELEKIVTKGGVTVAHYTSCPYDSGENETRSAAAGQFWIRDGLFSAARLCALLSRTGKSLKDCVSELPPFDSLSDDYTFQGKAPRLTDIGTPSQEGVLIEYDTGRVRVIPRRNGSFRLFVDTVNAEMASEIMSETKKKLDNFVSGISE
ncbi:MAG: sugar phosphate nucleotidyltransferase [Eubacteriales bacterium]|nr:sugar phosphate nucleotidyltransferase [Eubacteriales bacterium]